MPPPWDEERFRAVIRSFKPFTPKLRRILERVVYSARAYEQAHAQYLFDTAITGEPDLSRLRATLLRMAKARREALIALGEDPNTSDLLPQVETIPHDASPAIDHQEAPLKTTPAIPYVDTVLDGPPVNEAQARLVRLQAFLRSKPLTPEIVQALRRLYDRQQEFAQAYKQYVVDVARTGIRNRSRIDKILPEFAQARRDALNAMGADPDPNSTELFPAVPKPFYDA